MTRCTVPCKNFDTCGNLRMPEAKTGFCKDCWSKGQFGGVVKALFADPEHRALVSKRLAEAISQPGHREKLTSGIRAGHERRTEEAIAGFTPEQVETFEAFRALVYSKKAAREAVLSGASPYAKQETKAAQLDEMYRLRREGMSYRKIGQVLGLAAMTVRRRMSLSGRGMINFRKPPCKHTRKKPRPKSAPDLTEAAILFGKRDQYNKPWTVARLAERYGVPPDAVEKAVARPST